MNFYCSSGAGAVAAAASAHQRSGGSIFGGASAHQRSGQWHSSAVAVAAAATSAAAAVDSRQRCSRSGARDAPSGLDFALAAWGVSSGGGICGGALAQQRSGQRHSGTAAVAAAATEEADAVAQRAARLDIGHYIW